jgi:hypothetical protein
MTPETAIAEATAVFTVALIVFSLAAVLIFVIIVDSIINWWNPPDDPRNII